MTRVQMILAMALSMVQAGTFGMTNKIVPRTDLPESLQIKHLTDMLEKINEEKDNIEGFDDTKVARWLGWFQAGLVANDVLTLEDCKEINKKVQALV
jgi:hypothetical protein